MGTFLVSVVALLFAAAAAENAETPAAPSYRPPPEYPVACIPAPGEPTPPKGTVTIQFDLTRRGLPENVRVRESSDPYFEEAAVAAARSWKYAPRRVDGDAAPQQDLEVTFSFVLTEPTTVQEFDARPFLRVPPKYPERCRVSARTDERVLVEFDVTAEGATTNIRVVESSSTCFNASAKRAVSAWRYRPKVVNGAPVPRVGVQTTLVYQLSNSPGVPPEFKVRRPLWDELMRVQRELRKEDRDPQKAAADLAEIEAKYGATFSRAELSVFHQIRAQARVAAQDYRSALDDLRVVQRVRANPDGGEAVAQAIERLEAVVAAQDSAAAKNAAPGASTEAESAVEFEPEDPQ